MEATYKMARSNGSEFTEVVTSVFPGATPGRFTCTGVAELRERVARLRERGFRPAKFRGGLNRAFRILAGKPVSEMA